MQVICPECNRCLGTIPSRLAWNASKVTFALCPACEAARDRVFAQQCADCGEPVDPLEASDATQNKE